MFNKKCKLPEGPFKRARKGFEEINVPAPKSKPVGEGELVAVDSLPEWAREAFGAKVWNLDRVQNKLYPVVSGGAYEPILLRAPTGAGKVRLPPVALVRLV